MSRFLPNLDLRPGAWRPPDGTRTTCPRRRVPSERGDTVEDGLDGRLGARGPHPPRRGHLVRGAATPGFGSACLGRACAYISSRTPASLAGPRIVARSSGGMKIPWATTNRLTAKLSVDVPLQPPVADGHGDREDQQRRAHDEGGDEYPPNDEPHRAENARLALGWLFSEPDVVVIGRCLLHISRIGG